jgi:hypothetical protein
MPNLMKQVSEYLFRTKTAKEYNRDRNFKLEFVTDPKDLKFFLNNSRIDQYRDFLFGSIVPNLIDIASLAYSFVANEPPYGLILGEGIRLLNIFSSNQKKRINKNLRQLNITLSKGEDGLKDSLDELRNSVKDLERKINDPDN